LIEHIGDIDIKIKIEIINHDQQILPRLEERLGTLIEIVHESFDFPIIQKVVSSDHITFES
jgi:hypothetical protein